MKDPMATKLLEILNSRKRIDTKEIDACMTRLSEKLKEHTKQFDNHLVEALASIPKEN